MIWQLFDSSCWAEASLACPVSYDHACLGRGETRAAAVRAAVRSGRKITLWQIHFSVFVWLWSSCYNIMVGLWLDWFFWLVLLWSHRDFSALIPEPLESIMGAAVGHPITWVPPAPDSHSPAISPHTLPSPLVLPGQLSPWVRTLLLKWCQKWSVESQTTPCWFLSWNTVAELGGTEASLTPNIIHDCQCLCSSCPVQLAFCGPGTNGSAWLCFITSSLWTVPLANFPPKHHDSICVKKALCTEIAPLILWRSKSAFWIA